MPDTVVDAADVSKLVAKLLESGKVGATLLVLRSSSTNLSLVFNGQAQDLNLPAGSYAIVQLTDPPAKFEPGLYGHSAPRGTQIEVGATEGD